MHRSEREAAVFNGLLLLIEFAEKEQLVAATELLVEAMEKIAPLLVGSLQNDGRQGRPKSINDSRRRIYDKSCQTTIVDFNRYRTL